MNETAKKFIHLAIGVVLFPVVVIGVVPGLLIAEYGYTLPHVNDVGFWFSKPLLPGGVVLILWTVILFFIFGKGTPVPWAPPKTLVQVGPYRFVRNPMMLGVLMVVLGEALIISSMAIALWFAALFAAMNVFIVFFEEPGLKKRFGENYVEYTRHVGRWIPRLSGWPPADEVNENLDKPDPLDPQDP